jgi:Ca2+-binding EF-hand superfamily protein
LLDEDGSKAVSRSEFETLGFLFGFSKAAVKQIYDEFDVSGNQVHNSKHYSIIPRGIFKKISALKFQLIDDNCDVGIRLQ